MSRRISACAAARGALTGAALTLLVFGTAPPVAGARPALAPPGPAAAPAVFAPPAQADVALREAADVYRRGEFRTALARFQEALALARGAEDAPAHASALSSIGATYDKLGHYREALESYEQALALRQAMNDSAGVATTLAGIGSTYQGLGQHRRALERYEAALDIRRRLGDGHGAGEVLVSIGAAHFGLGAMAEALASYSEALPLLQRAEDRAGEAAALGNLGVVFGRLDRAQDALDVFQAALALRRDLGDRWGEGAVVGNMGSVHAGLRRYDEAQRAFEQARRVLSEAGDRRGEATMLANLGVLEDRRFRLQPALRYYLQAIDINEQLRTTARLEELKTSLAQQIAPAYENAVLVLMRLGRHEEAFDLAERSRARTFLDQLGNIRLDIRAGASPQLVEREQALRSEMSALEGSVRQERARPDAERPADVVRQLEARLSALRGEYENVLTGLKLGNSEYAALVSVTPLTLSEVQQRLDRDTTLLSYFVTPDETLAFLVTRDALRVVKLPVGAAPLRDLVQGQGFGSRNRDPRALRQLYDWLIAPLGGQLQTGLLGVIPHQDLHYVPFAALTDGQRYLGDAHTVFSLPSASVLPFLQQKRKTGPVNVLPLGQGQAQGFPPLVGADQEVRAIGALYGATPVIGAGASEGAFKARAGEHRIVHVAAHGELRADNPLFSRLVLAPDAENDGSLEVHEVYGLDLAATELVVLSACQSGLGARSQGDDLVGLSRAFLYAGTPALVASLWNVNDAATAELMRAFYAHLSRGEGAAPALRAAQIETRKQFPDPYYWAPFVLIGDPQALAPRAP